MRDPPQTIRSNNSPIPGQPLAKLEKRRRIRILFRRLPDRQCPANPPKERIADYFESLELNDSTLEAYHGCMGAVVGIQFGEDVFDAALYRFFGD